MFYKIVKENLVNGNRVGYTQIYHSDATLEIGRLYMFLPGLEGGFRVLKEVEAKTEVDIKCRN